MKKNLVLAALAVVGIMSATSCGGAKDTSYSGVNTEITIWATAKEEPVVKKIVDAYNAKQSDESAKFKYKFVAVAEKDAGTTLAKDPMVEGAPALVLCADDQVFNLVSKKSVIEIKGSYKENIIANNSDVSVKGASYNGKLYGYPVTSDNGYFLYYNSDEVKAEEAKSFETLLSVAKAKGKQVFFTLNDGWYANSFLMSPQANGLSSLSWTSDAEGKVSYTTDWDNPTGVKVSEYIGNLIKTYYEDGTLQVGDDAAKVAAAQEGKAIAIVSGTWMESNLTADTAWGAAKTKATKLPEYHIEDKAYQMASFTGSKIYTINSTRPVAEQKAAAALADLLTNKESQLIRFEERQTIPCNKEALNDDRYTKNVTISANALALQNNFAAVQAQAAQDRYWDVGKAIGQAYMDGKFDDADNTTIKSWSEFLKTQMDILRKAQ